MNSSLFAFCSDCDFMTWEGYREVHSVLDSLKLPAGDSFWLFDPSGSDMALFTYDLKHKGPRHDELLEEIVTGRIDVLHSAGSYGAKFNMGFRPERTLVAGALEYLAKNGATPKIWSNHGDLFNTQNIGGSAPAAHHRGDLPDSEVFILDLLLEFGIEFFWLDRLLFGNSSDVYRVVGQEKSRSGHTINTFARFYGLQSSPNAQNLGDQLSAVNLANFSANRQSTILYQHWGCHHDQSNAAYSPKGKVLADSSIAGLERLAEAHHSNKVRVVRLYELLKLERSKPLGEDAQRIGSLVVAPEAQKEDNFYYNQYNLHSVDYFRNRLRNLDIRGTSALDAGCGVGQWSFALADLGFTEVAGIDASPEAYAYLTDISKRMRQDSPQFQVGSIEALPYRSDHFDFLLSYGVIFCAHVDVALQEFQRVLKPDGEAYICLNADGWYQYLIDVRFRDDDILRKRALTLPIWNAYFDRVGGREVFETLERSGNIDRFMEIDSSPLPINEATELVHSVMGGKLSDWQQVIDSYSDEVLQLLAEYCRAAFHLIREERRHSIDAGAQLRRQSNGSPVRLIGSIRSMMRRLRRPSLFQDTGAIRSASGPGKKPPYIDFLSFILLNGSTQSRVYQPKEFEKLANRIGLEMSAWAPDAKLSRSNQAIPVKPIYDENYNGMPAVWECILVKSKPSSRA